MTLEEEEKKPFDVAGYIREKKAGHMSVVDEPLTALSLKKTLEMARRFLGQGNLQQALGLYRRLINEFPDSKEATEARTYIVEIAQKFEGEGQHYTALALYRSLQG